VPEPVDHGVSIAPDPRPRRLEHRRGAVPRPQSALLLQRLDAASRDLDRLRSRGDPLPALPGPEPPGHRDVTLLPPREPNLVRAMGRVRDPGLQRTRSLPAVGALINEPAYSALVTQFGRQRVVDAIREQVEGERDGESAGATERLVLVEARLRADAAP